LGGNRAGCGKATNQKAVFCNFHEIKLQYTRLLEKDSANGFLLIPVLVFYEDCEGVCGSYARTDFNRLKQDSDGTPLSH
jgi:hypothetical protein